MKVIGGIFRFPVAYNRRVLATHSRGEVIYLHPLVIAFIIFAAAVAWFGFYGTILVRKDQKTHPQKKQ